jgi:hypothetical protein
MAKAKNSTVAKIKIVSIMLVSFHCHFFGGRDSSVFP